MSVRVSVTHVNPPRAYRQVARAETTAALRQRILDAVDELFLPTADSAVFSLQDVAQRAGTTVQTVLRHFGSKGDLVAAAAARGTQRVLEERRRVPVGDVAAVARYLAGHYEEVGPWVLRLLQLEPDLPSVAAVTGRGRSMHRQWVEEVLVPLLGPADVSTRARQAAVLVALTDLLTWRVMRLEQGLSRDAYGRAVRETLEAVIAASWTSGEAT